MAKRIAETISVPELFRMFPDEEICVRWFEQARWGGIPTCPHCGSQDDISRPESKPDYYWCKACRVQFNVKTNTPLHATKKPLQEWIYVIYSVLTWEVDETYVGGKERNKHESRKRKAGRGPVGKTPVIGARERGGKVKAMPLSSTDGHSLINFVETHTKQGATVYTDDAAAYSSLPTIFNKYRHESVKHSAGEYVRGAVHTNGIESVWSVFKRSVIGTWHHVSNKHLGRYVNEAAFRLNEGNCEVDTIDRMQAFASRIGGKRLSYRDLIGR